MSDELPEVRTINEVETLDQYMAQYGALLGRQVRDRIKPLHTPGVDPLIPIDSLRTPLPAQHHLITANVRLLRKDKVSDISGQMGTGKAQPLDAMVLTPAGWRSMGSLSVGDSVVDPDGGVATVTGVFPQGEKDVYRVTFTDGSCTECCDDHLWAVRTADSKMKGRPFRVLPLKEIRSSLHLSSTHSGGGKNLRWYIPIAAPVEFVQQELPIDPYLLGVLLGDGCMASKNAVSFSTADGYVADSVSALLPSGIKAVKRTGSPYDYSITTGQRGGVVVNPVLSCIRELGLSGVRSYDKFIPRKYLFSSALQRLALLQGILDTDGSTDGRIRGAIEFNTSSKQLSDDVLSLVRSLGGTATVRERHTTYTHGGEKRRGRLSYRMVIRLPSGVCPFRLPRKESLYRPSLKYGPSRGVKSVEFVGRKECQCISVSSKRSLYVTDDFIVTHNTYIGMMIAHTHANGKPYRGLVFCPPHLVNKWCRELIMTVPGCTAIAVSSWQDLTRLRNRPAPSGPEWWVISQNTAKLGPSWEPAFLQRKVDDGAQNQGYIYCPHCGARIEAEEKETGIMKAVSATELAKRKMDCERCESPLWSWGGNLKRWPGASYVSRQLRGLFDYLIIDEAHQEKGAETAQGNAAGTLISACRKVITLTGTKIGGQADHIRTLSFRLIPHRLVSLGFEWSDYMPFSERYGRIERRVTVKGNTLGKDNRNSRGSSGKTAKFVRPGIMPRLFSDVLISNTSFISLQDVSDDLPVLTESLHPVAMDAELAAEYGRIEQALTQAVSEMAAKGDKRLLGAMLQTLLCYPDLPFGWNEIGYYESDGDGGLSWCPVVKPRSLDQNANRNKEDALIEDCVSERNEGRQVWIFTTMTDKRDVCERLRVKMMCRGLRVMILRAEVKPREREEWIAKWGPKCDVVISHPQLVETGLELFDKGGGHNFCTLIWYLTGYNLFTLRQASARHYRIGQIRECRTKYYFYQGTMQERALTLMGQKLSASQAIEGKFSTEGLVAMSGEDGGSIELELAKSLVDRVSVDATRAWEKITASSMAGVPAVSPAPAPIPVATPIPAPAPLPTRRETILYTPKEKSGQTLIAECFTDRQLALFG